MHIDKHTLAERICNIVISCIWNIQLSYYIRTVFRNVIITDSTAVYCVHRFYLFSCCFCKINVNVHTVILLLNCVVRRLYTH